MKPIELELWKPKKDDPRYMEREGRRSAEEVFKELEQRLDSMGMLPDEYLLLDRDWQDGRLIPEGADIFVTTDYGGSEGVYLDAYDRYFYINRSKDGSLAFIRNHKAIDEKLRTCGFFLIAETDFKKTTAEILDIYRRRDVMEKSFDHLKNELDMKRLRSHSSETAQGKLFVAFIALIVRSYLLRHLKDYMRENTCTLRKVLLELDKLKSLCVPGGKEARLLNPPTRRQGEIYDVLDLPLPIGIG